MLSITVKSLPEDEDSPLQHPELRLVRMDVCSSLCVSDWLGHRLDVDWMLIKTPCGIIYIE